MIKIINISDSNKHFDLAIKEYEKRLGKSFEHIKLKPSKKKDINKIIEDETSMIFDKIEKLSGYKILLDIYGRELDTIDLSKMIVKNKNKSIDTIFVIWWRDGLDVDKLDNHIDFKLSISKMTLPHSMAYLILLEQIYRSHMIDSWKSFYHK